MSKNIKYLMLRELEQQYRPGTSKRAEIRKNRAAAYDEAMREGAGVMAAATAARDTGRSDYIHSASTLRTYCQQTRRFGNWLISQGLGHCTMEEARSLAPEYIFSHSSFWTQQTARSALARVFGCLGPDICELAPRGAENIIRGRIETPRAAAIERNHPDLAEVCRSVGLRHLRELDVVTAANFFTGDDGHLYCHIQGKGGRWRDALVLDGPGRGLIEAAIREHPTGRLFRVPSHSNVHGWRADYATRCYEYAMTHGMATGELYRPRNMDGVAFDKGALAWVSAQLGHGPGRFYTVVHNYLSYGEAD